MSRNKKYSYWIIGIIIFFIIIAFIPFEDFLSSSPKVGVIEINSPIMDSKKIVEDLNYFYRQSRINAIVIRLDTPGGGVAASQEVYEKVREIAEESNKPIVASMGGVAASGGYYIALGADTIVANPGTATGSIGVIMSYPIVGELMNKIGVHYETIKSAELKDSGSPFRDLTDLERIYFQSLIDDLHSQFVEVIVKERNLSLERASELANGQVYSGRQALDNRLVDIIGTFEDAVYLAARKAGYDESPKTIYPPKEKKSLFEVLIGDILQSSAFDNLLMYPKPEYKISFPIK